MVGAEEGGGAWVGRVAVAAVAAEEVEKEAMAEEGAGKVVTADVAVEMAVMAAVVGAMAGEVCRYLSTISRHCSHLANHLLVSTGRARNHSRFNEKYEWFGNGLTAV